nr:reverse transcriptase domain-containing protein [Tanacetum cinerariifolium]
EDSSPESPMADNRTMAQLLQAPTEGFDESFYEAWERFNDLLRACPHHGFSELHQLDTFYNALNITDQDSLNSATGGNFLDKMPRECLKKIESKSKVRQTQAKAVVAKVGTSSSTPAISSDVLELKDMVKALLLDKKNQSPAPTPSTTPAPVKAVELSCVTCEESPMADNRTMAQFLQAPTEGYEDVIVIPEITANNFELKYGLINLVQNKQFFGHDKEDPHAHIRYFNQITSTMRVPNVPSSSIKLMLFPFSLEGAARIWLEKEPPRSIQTWDDLVSKFINQFFPSSKTTNLRNEITRFQQRFKESFYEAWERFNNLLRACPHHGFSELHQLDIFYNALNVNDQDSLNSVAGGNFLDKMPRECLKIIESKSKVRQTRTKAVVARVDNIQEYVSQAAAANYNQGNTGFRPQMVANQIRPPRFPPHQNNQNHFNRGNNFNQNRGGNFNQSNPSSFKQGQLHRPQVNQAPVYQAPIPQTQRVSQLDFESYVKANDAVLRNMQSQGQSTQNQCQNIQNQNQNLQNQMATLTDMMSKLISANTASSSGLGTLPVAPVSAPMPNLKPSIPYPSRRENKKRHDQANEQIEKFYKIFKEMSFEISFTYALILMPKFASTLKALIGNKEKLSEMARTTMNEHFSAVILNKLPRKLGDPGKFLIPCEFSRMDECLALADLGASINLMPFSVWEALSLPELTPTCMTLELADRSVSKPIGIAKDFLFKVGIFHFPADFVVVDFEPDPRVLLILE